MHLLESSEWTNGLQSHRMTEGVAASKFNWKKVTGEVTRAEIKEVALPPSLAVLGTPNVLRDEALRRESAVSRQERRVWLLAHRTDWNLNQLDGESTKSVRHFSCQQNRLSALRFTTATDCLWPTSGMRRHCASEKVRSLIRSRMRVEKKTSPKEWSQGPQRGKRTRNGDHGAESGAYQGNSCTSRPESSRNTYLHNPWRPLLVTRLPFFPLRAGGAPCDCPLPAVLRSAVRGDG